MTEFFNAINLPQNYVYGFFVLLPLGYWLITIFGFLSISALDGLFDFDLDADADHDINTDYDADAGVADAGIWISTLSFLGVGKVPVTLIVTVLMFLQGVIGIVLNNYIIKFLGTDFWSWIAVLAGFVLSFTLALFPTAWMMKPLYPLFQDYGVAETSESLVGQIATVSTGTLDSSFGQAKLTLPNGEGVEVSVRIPAGANPLHYGDKVLIVDYSEEKNMYYAESYDNSIENL